MSSPQSCPEPARWQQLLAGELPPEAQATLSGHLDTCLNCQRALEGLASGDKPLTAVARAVGKDPSPAGTALYRAMAELKNEASQAATLTGATAPLLGAALSCLAPPEQPGHLGRLGPYEIYEEIGRGGMGVVLKAFDSKLERLVAIKVLAPHLAADDLARKRFIREAQAAAAVRHEHVVTIYGVDEADGVPYIVMEYVRGPSLADRLERGGPLEWQEVARIGKEIASGLAAAHAQGLVHRDVKPGNILLEDGQRVKITDFGLARTVDEVQLAHVGPRPETGIDLRLTQVGLVAGTPQYMAPEQARGAPVDHRADLFSLGSVLYALCAGRPPFVGDTLVAVLYNVCEQTPPPLSQLHSNLPYWLISLIEKLQAKDPAERCQSAAEVAELLNGQLISLQLPPKLRRQFGYEYRSRRKLWGLPLVHIAYGVDPLTGRQRVARGIIAIGNVGIGVVALGGVALGGIALGGLSFGLISLAGVAVGLLAVGGCAVGGIAFGGLAIGGIAIGGGAFGYYALGGDTAGMYRLDGKIQNPVAVDFFRRWLGWCYPSLRDPGTW